MARRERTRCPPAAEFPAGEHGLCGSQPAHGNKAGIPYAPENSKVLLVCSVEENEGKSTVAANIALALAEHGREVLLLDGDLRKPAQFKVFDKREQAVPSFSDVLEGSAALENCLAQNKTSAVWELFQYKPVSQAGSFSPVRGFTKSWRNCGAEWMSLWWTALPLWRQPTRKFGCIRPIQLRWWCARITQISASSTTRWTSSGKAPGDFAGIILNAFRRERPRVSESGRYE